MTLAFSRPDWMKDGRCLTDGVRTKLFFSDTLDGIIAAQKVCRTCPVQDRCLEYAMEKKIAHGVWGGASERERIRLRRRRLRDARL